MLEALKLFRLLTKAACVALVFCYLLGFGSLWFSWLNFFPPFVFQYLLASLGLTLTLAILRHKNWAIAMACLSLILGGEYVQTNKILAHKPSVIEGGYQLNILSYNLFRYNENIGETLEKPRAKQQDLIVLFEANKHTKKAAKKLEDTFPYQISILGLSSKSLIVLSKWPLLKQERITMFEDDPSQNFLLSFQIQPDKNLPATQIYTLHTQAPIPVRRINDRNEELAFFARKVHEDRSKDNLPQIALGDLNITPYNPHYKKTLKTSGLDKPATYNLPAHSWPSFAPWFLRFQIDHILTSPDNIAPLSIDAVYEAGSDHRALYGSFIISPTEDY